MPYVTSQPLMVPVTEAPGGRDAARQAPRRLKVRKLLRDPRDKVPVTGRGGALLRRSPGPVRGAFSFPGRVAVWWAVAALG